MADQKASGEKFMKKAEREKCWSARDKFWDCLKANNENESKCADLRNGYTDACPPTWVSHFDRKFQYEKFKVLLKTEGFQEAADSEFIKDKKQKN